MFLKQLKQLTFSATRRNANLLKLPRLYSSPAVSQTLTNSKPSKKLSRDERRLVVESFVSKYRAANAGKFPTLKVTVKEVGGNYYIVRNILQELKLKPNAPVSQVPASPENDASSLKQDQTVESSHPSSDEASIQGDNNLVVSATHGSSETVVASLDKDVDSRCDGSTHLPEIQTSMVSEGGLKNSEIEEEGTLVHLGHLEGANVLPATHDRRETETAAPNSDVGNKCDGTAHFPDSQTLEVVEGCLKNSETEEDGKLTQLVSQEPRADHLDGANVLTTETGYQCNVTTATEEKIETETDTLSKDVDSKCDSLPENQTLKVADECLKNSEIKDEGTLTELVSQEPKADHLEGANVLPEPYDKRESETVPPPNNDVDFKCDGSTLLPDSQASKVSEKCLTNSETKKEGNLTHLGSQEPKADHIEGAADSANVLPSETRQVAEKGDGEVKTEATSSAWSNIISFAKGFANFWRKG